MTKLNRRDKKIATYLGRSTLFRIESTRTTRDLAWTLPCKIETRKRANGIYFPCRPTVILHPKSFLLLIGFDVAPTENRLTQADLKFISQSKRAEYCLLDFLYEEQVYKNVICHKGSLYRIIVPIETEGI